MKSVTSERRASSGPLSLMSDVAALVAQSLSLLMSFSMASAVVTSTYVRMATASGRPGAVASLVAAIDQAGIGGALARGGLMVVLFVVAALLLASAGARVRKWLARTFALLYVALAAVSALFGVLYLDNSAAYSLRDFVSITGMTVALVLFSIVLGAVGEIPAWLPYFGAPFVCVLLLHALLLTFARGIAPDLYFAGRLLLFLVLGLIAVAYHYASALIRAAA